MSNVLERLKKKRGSPVEIEGDTFYVRSLTIGEMKRLNELDDTAKVAFAIGCSLVNQDGSQVMPDKANGETDAEWSTRIGEQLVDVPGSTVLAINEAIARLIKPSKPEAVAKN